jgi:phosphoribosylglycinamide formyltransferase-1
VARLKVGVLISGRGSNLQALLDACADPAFPAEIVLVISNVPAALGLGCAEAAGIPAVIVNHKDFADRASFDAKMDEALRAADVELVALAGFMRLLSTGFVERWRSRMINIHPSLLPAFKGLRTHAQALAAGVKQHGCTVHWVTPDLDDGPTILQGTVPVLEGDTEESLAQRVLEIEHRIYPEALRLIAEGRDPFSLRSSG